MPNISLPVATPEVEAALSDKMQSIALKEKEQDTQRHATDLHLGYINLVGFPIGPDTISIIPQADAERLQVVCFLRTIDQIRLASDDPMRPEINEIAQTLSDKYRANVELYVVSEHSLQTALRLYARLPKIKKMGSGIEITTTDIEQYQQEIEDIRDINDHLERISVTDAFTLILAGALLSRSSDIHIEAEETDIRVRYRIDGVLINIASIPADRWQRIISRIKLLAGLKLNIISAPQDGHITVTLEGDKVDIRVSTLPTAFGESVVMRLLRASAGGISFDDLGLRGRAYDEVKKEIDRPNGMVIVTGPTGSGKTTTLYAALNILNKPESKIITLEDPIEYKIAGVNQSQVNWSKGYTFATGLRSMLRQDPDIVMIGEIRDTETADTAIQAALTGHLVLSTVHTNDAAGAVPRFLSMGAKPYLLAPALNAVVGQRLVRRICPNCISDDSLTPDIARRVREVLAGIPPQSGYQVDPNRPLTMKRGQGCDQCHGLGYLGRLGIFEVLIVDGEVESIILANRASEYELRQAGVKQGMVTMVQDGLLKALDGMTSVEEVFRVSQ